MRKTITGIIAALLVSQTLPAWADGRSGMRPFGGHPQQQYQRHHDRHRHHNHHHHGNHALAWGIAGLALGGVLLAETWRAPPPVVVAPAPTKPPGQMWYYCDAYGAYYPYVAECPGGWRAVPAD